MFPLIEEDQVQGGLYDPDAGLVVPRSQALSAGWSTWVSTAAS
jgi:hypothetical protein